MEGQRRRKTASEAVLKLVRRGVAAVDVLDAIVRPRLEDRPDLLGAWKSVKRLGEPGGPGVAVPEEPPAPLVKAA